MGTLQLQLLRMAHRPPPGPPGHMPTTHMLCTHPMHPHTHPAHCRLSKARDGQWRVALDPEGLRRKAAAVMPQVGERGR